MSDAPADELPPGALGREPRAGDVTAPGDPAAASTAPGRGDRRRRRRRRAADDAGGPGTADAAGTQEAPPQRPLTEEERRQHAVALAYRHLSKRDRTVSEVRTHLERREVDEPSIVAAIEELLEVGYLDDGRYAERFVEDKRRLEGWGRLRIEQGLRRTGVPTEVADRALAEDPAAEDEHELALEALERRLGGRAPDGDRGRQKALRALATKGYPLDIAYAAVRAYERRCAEREDG